MSHLRPAAAIAALAVLPLLAACSASVSLGDNGFDRSAFEQRAVSEIDDDYAKTGRTVSTYECDYPESEITTGTAFTCVADIDGAKVRTQITITDDDGGFKLTTDDLLYDMPTVAKQLAQPVADQLGGNVTVNCGEDVKALTAGSTFQCTVVNDGGATRPLTYSVSAGGTNDRWEVN